MSGDASALIQLGLVGAPFGVRGWVKLRSHTDPPEGLLKHKTLQLGRPGALTEYRIEARGKSGGALTAKFVGIDDRDQAAALRGSAVWVRRDSLPAPKATEFYQADLIGCEVHNLADEPIGVVSHFVETPAHTLMVVRGASEFMGPALPKHLKRVDLEVRRVVVDWDAATG
jgi:16S rRNA processing protein RimM